MAWSRRGFRPSLRVLWLGLFMLMACAVPIALSQPAFAESDLLEEACLSAPESNACDDRVNSGDPSPLTGLNGVLYRISTIVAVIAGVIAVIMIIVAGLRYVTSGGDAQKAAEAKKTILGAIIGIVVILAAQTIITFVVRRVQ